MSATETKHTHTTEFRVDAYGKVVALSKWRSDSWRWRELKPQLNSHGYLRVRVYRNGKRVSLFVHKLVARYYLSPQPSPDHEIRHLDGNRTNNNYLNLCWGTRKENADDRERHGKTSRGESHGAAIKAGLAQVGL